jgi:hypothetical protein
MKAAVKTITATEEWPDNPKSLYVIDDDTTAFKVYLVWALTLEGKVLLRAITTSEARASVYADMARRDHHEDIRRVYIEPTALNHLYAGSISRR